MWEEIAEDLAIGERELLLNSQQLVRENEQWKEKPVIQVAEDMELLHRQNLLPNLLQRKRSSIILPFDSKILCTHVYYSRITR